MSNILEAPASPVPVAFVAFDSTTGALAAGSWGATVLVVVADQGFTLTPSFAAFGGAAGDLFVQIALPTASGAAFRQAIEQIPGGGQVNVSILDAAGALALVPANTRIMVRIYRRNGAIGV